MSDPTCIICGAIVARRTAKTCTKECGLVNASRNKKARHDRLKSDPAYIEQRRISGRATYRRHYERTQALRLERTASWRERNAHQVAAYGLEYRRTNPDIVRAKNQRRRARLADAFVEDIDLAILWERDGGNCGICLEPVDPSIPWPQKMTKTLDHILPLSKGGKHSWANAQLAHAVCNSRKNDRVA